MKSKKGKITVLSEKDYEDYLTKLSGGQKLELPEIKKD